MCVYVQNSTRIFKQELNVHLFSTPVSEDIFEDSLSYGVCVCVFHNSFEPVQPLMMMMIQDFSLWHTSLGLGLEKKYRILPPDDYNQLS